MRLQKGKWTGEHETFKEQQCVQIADMPTGSSNQFQKNKSEILIRTQPSPNLYNIYAQMCTRDQRLQSLKRSRHSKIWIQKRVNNILFVLPPQ